jgi:DNA ligase-1
MEKFSQLVQQLEYSKSTQSKTEALVHYFRQANDSDKLWAISILSQRRPARITNLKILRKWALEHANIQEWLFEASYQIVGDLSETISLIVNNKTVLNDLSLTDLVSQMKQLRAANEMVTKAFVLQVWDTSDFSSRFLFNKLITGGFRVSLAQKVIANALAKVTGKKAEFLAHRLTGDWNPFQNTFEEVFLSENIWDAYSEPYPFFLASSIKDSTDELGSIEDWIIEKKWGGLRCQLICRENRIFLWSRGGELITNQFPEFNSLSDILPSGTVLDGQLMIWHGDHPGGFNELQKRLARKKPEKKLLTNHPSVIIAFDYLEEGGTDIRNKSNLVRREKLESLFRQKGHLSDSLLLSERVLLKNWTQVRNLWQQSRQQMCEGIIFKRLSAPYEIGRKSGDWWKWKVEPLKISAVLLYVQNAIGQRGYHFNEFTFAVWFGEQLVPIAKVFPKLPEEDLKEIGEWVKINTIERFGPVRSVAPELVFEIAFEDIVTSLRHKSGLQLRFPRIVNWEKGTLPDKADSLHTLRSFVHPSKSSI